MRIRILAVVLVAAMMINSISITGYALEDPEEMAEQESVSDEIPEMQPEASEPEEVVLTYEEAYGAPAAELALFAQREEKPSFYFKVYNQLEEPAQKVYRALAENYELFRSPDQTIDVFFDEDEVPYDESDKSLITYYFCSAVAAFDYDHPESFWMNKSAVSAGLETETSAGGEYVSILTLKRNASCSDMFCPAYGGDEALADADIAEVNRNMAAVAAEAEKEEELYDKLRVINSYLIDENYYNRYVYRKLENRVSDQGLLKKAHNAASALTEQIWLSSADDLGDPVSPVCEGYARAFKMVCDALGIPCIVVSGANHMWNYVYDASGDGAWYGVDCTWNDQIRSNEYEVKVTPDDLRERYLLLGSKTVVGGYTFIGKHPANGAAWVGGTPFAVPVLSELSYKEKAMPSDPDPEPEPEPEYTVSFDTNGSREMVADVTRKAGELYGELPLPWREGYDFLGWFTDKSEGTEVKADDIFSAAEAQTLYARWQAKQYRILFDAAGGACGITEKEVLFDDTYGELPLPEREGHEFLGWFTEGSEGTKVEQDAVFHVAGDQTLYAHWKAFANLWIAGVADREYTGKPITQMLRVYDGQTLLDGKTDYSVTYRNNISAGRASLTVTCRGNYIGTKNAFFTIAPKQLACATVDRVYSVNAPKAGKAVKVLQSVKDGKTVLRAGGIDYRVSYRAEDGREVSLTDLPAGRYRMILEGCGNYTGTLEYGFTVAAENVPAMSTAKVTLNAVKVPFGKELPVVKSIKIGGVTYTDTGAERLEDLFSVEYPENAADVGQHQIVIRALDERFAGEVGASYTVEGIKITRNMISAVGTYSYGGEPVVPYFETALQEGTDYTVTCSNHGKVGKATALIRGIGNYTGSVKLYYTIGRGDIKKASVTVGGAAKYDLAGAKPLLAVSMGKNLLQEGKDYTVMYQDHNAVSPEGTATAYAIIKGKGSFSGTKVARFSVEASPVTEEMIRVNDCAYSSKKSVYKQSVTVKQGKKSLKAGRDYTVSYSSDAQIAAEDMAKGYHEITVTVTGIEGSGFTGSAVKTYTVYKAARKASKLHMTVCEKTYTGGTVTLQPEDLTVTDAAGSIIPKEDVTVLSCRNNVKVGKKASAIVSVRGYGGTKTVRFSIIRKKITD